MCSPESWGISRWRFLNNVLLNNCEARINISYASLGQLHNTARWRNGIRSLGDCGIGGSLMSVQSYKPITITEDRKIPKRNIG